MTNCVPIFSENKRVATSYIQEKIPELTVILSDATYLLWVNCEEVSQNAKELVQKDSREKPDYIYPMAMSLAGMENTFPNET